MPGSSAAASGGRASDFIRRFLGARQNPCDNLSDIVLSVAATREIERIYLEQDGFSLMEKAGTAMAAEIMRLYPFRGTPFIILAGNGNNGGDGYVVGRELIRNGYRSVLTVQTVPQKPGIAAVRARESYLAAGGILEPGNGDAADSAGISGLIASVRGATPGISPVIIDAIAGIGVLRGRPGNPDFERMSAAVQEINGSGLEIVSLDVPSLLNADTGIPVSQGLAVRAYATVTVFSRKPGLLLGRAGDFAGKVVTVLDSLSEFAVNARRIQHDERIFAMDYHDLKAFLPVRARCAHKGDAGRLLLVGGSTGMEGALITAGRAAVRSGAGLVRTVFLSERRDSMNAINPEIMTGIPENIARDLAWSDAAVVGPGMGRSARDAGIFREIYGNSRKLLVDADGLRWLRRLCDNPALAPSGRPETLVLTPHIGEGAMLTGRTVAEVLDDPLGTIREIAVRYGATVVLKSAATMVSDGDYTVILDTGSRGMASGGMGDLLSGVIGALIAGGMDPFQAAVLGVAVHGEAGILSERADGAIGMCAGDLLPFIRRLLNGRENGLQTLL